MKPCLRRKQILREVSTSGKAIENFRPSVERKASLLGILPGAGEKNKNSRRQRAQPMFTLPSAKAIQHERALIINAVQMREVKGQVFPGF